MFKITQHCKPMKGYSVKAKGLRFAGWTAGFWFPARTLRIVLSTATMSRMTLHTQSMFLSNGYYSLFEQVKQLECEDEHLCIPPWHGAWTRV